jgi:hypothetical protein
MKDPQIKQQMAEFGQRKPFGPTDPPTKKKKKASQESGDPTRDRLSKSYPKYNIQKTKKGPANEYSAHRKDGSAGSFTIRSGPKSPKKQHTMAEIINIGLRKERESKK